MNNSKELTWCELKGLYQPSDFSFRTTEEVEAYEELIGQEDTLEAIKRAIAIDSKGFNIYVCGADSEEKEEAIKNEIKKLASQKETPLAIGYIYNFDQPEVPVLIEMDTNEAEMLKDDLEEMVAFMINELPLMLQSEESEEKREKILSEFDAYKQEQLLILAESAASKQMTIKMNKEGIYFTPFTEKGEKLSKDQYNELELTEKKEIQDKVEQLNALADKINQNISKEEEKYLVLYEAISQEIVLREMGAIIKQLKEKYESYPLLQNYFNGIAGDILDHIEILCTREETDEEANGALQWNQPRVIEKLTNKYSLNLLVAYKEEMGAPVIVDYDWPYSNLSGRLLVDLEPNMSRTDFMHIRPGLLHYANGGYLLLHMQKLLENPSSWGKLKMILKTGKIRIEGNEDVGISLVNPIRPESIENRAKVILLGNEEVFNVLYQADEDFKKLFKTRIIFSQEIDCNKEIIQDLAGVIRHLCEKEGFCPVTLEAILKVVSYGNRQTSTLMKLPNDIDALMDIIREANGYAEGVIDSNCIESALSARHHNYLRLQEKIDEQMKEDFYLIDTGGKKVGQVNGLAVYSIIDYSFGRPIRITATTYRGKQSIIDIEKEANLSGEIHTKGIHIITGFLGSQFAQDMPLSLNCHLCFEQSYGKIDGDSASSAELYAILSSLGDFPIAQNIAVTGSVNQFGEIQPIGGVNEKVEGFFNVCHKRGLKGNEGVLIPKQNVKELILRDDILESIKAKTFHIYPIGNVWEGIEMLADLPREEIVQRIKEKIKKFNQ